MEVLALISNQKQLCPVTRIIHPWRKRLSATHSPGVEETSPNLVGNNTQKWPHSTRILLYPKLPLA